MVVSLDSLAFILFFLVFAGTAIDVKPFSKILSLLQTLEF